MTIVVPVIVVVAVAVLALALLTGHGPKFGSPSSGQHKTTNTAAPRLPMGAVTFDTYPGQQQRGVFQVISRIVAAGGTMVTTGWQASDGVVRQQFLVSTNGGASWHLAPVRAPGGGRRRARSPGRAAGRGTRRLGRGRPAGHLDQPDRPDLDPRGHPRDQPAAARRLGVGDHARPRTATWPRAAAPGPAQDSTPAVIWTSRDGLTWQRMTAAQLGLAAPGETVPSISYATWRGKRHGDLRRGGLRHGGQILRRRVAEHERRDRVDPADDPGRSWRRERDQRPGLRRLRADRGAAWPARRAAPRTASPTSRRTGGRGSTRPRSTRTRRPAGGRPAW